MSDQVYMVWDIYDGVRSGIADYAGTPHHFECVFDERIDDFSSKFELKAIDGKTLKLAQEQWSIYRAWELSFHSGLEQIETHPGHSGVNLRYDQLEDLLQIKIKNTPVSKVVTGTFRAKEEQPTLPDGCLYEMEVDWDD